MLEVTQGGAGVVFTGAGVDLLRVVVLEVTQGGAGVAEAAEVRTKQINNICVCL